MEKNICILLSILAFFTLQVLAQTCFSSATITSQPTATVSVFDGYYVPDCLTISKQQKVVWGMFFVIILCDNF